MQPTGHLDRPGPQARGERKTYETGAEHFQAAPAPVPPAPGYPPQQYGPAYGGQQYSTAPGFPAGTHVAHPSQQYAAPAPQYPVAQYQVPQYPVQQQYATPVQAYPGYAPAGFGPMQATVMQVSARPGRGLSITALVVGIIAAVLLWIPGLDLILSIIATVFGAIGMGIAVRRNGPKGMAIAGLVLGILVLGWSILWWAALAAGA